MRRRSPRLLTFWLNCALLAGCAGRPANQRQDAGSTPGITVKDGSTPVADASSAIAEADGGAGFRVTISATAASVCPGQCVDLTATAFGGVPPYRFNWDHGLGSAAQASAACPTQTTRYTVTVDDASQPTAEFNVQNAPAAASLSIRVAPASACRDGGSSGASGASGANAAGGASVPIGPSRELCSLRAHVNRGSILSVQAQKNHQSVVDSKGNVVLIGSFTGTIDLGATKLSAGGSLDGFAIKLDSECHLLWAKSFVGQQGSGQLWLAGIAADEQDQLYLGGGFSGKTAIGDTTTAQDAGFAGMLIKLNPDGNSVWSNVFKGEAVATAVTDLIVDSQHHVTLIGYAGADTSFGGAPLGSLYAGSIPFLARFDTDGNFGWSQTFTSADLMYGLANRTRAGPSLDDSIVVTGWASQSIDFGAGMLSLGHGGRFLAKLNGTGQQLWLRALPHGADVDQWNWWKGGVAVDAQGSIVVLRDEPQTLPGDSGDRLLDDSVEKYSSAGSPTWQTRLSEASNFDNSWGSGLALFSDAHVLRFGSFVGTTAYAGQTVVSRGAGDVALVELDDAGKALWAYPMGGTLEDRVLGVAVDASDQIFASYVGNQTQNGDESDLIVVKVAR